MPLKQIFLSANYPALHLPFSLYLKEIDFEVVSRIQSAENRLLIMKSQKLLTQNQCHFETFQSKIQLKRFPNPTSNFKIKVHANRISSPALPPSQITNNASSPETTKQKSEKS